MGSDFREIALFSHKLTPVAEYLASTGKLTCFVDFSDNDEIAIKAFCDKNDLIHIPFTRWEDIENFIRKEKPQLLVSYKLTSIIPNDIISLFPEGGINIHPSMLPRYPGADPWFAIYYNMEPEGGITIHRLSSVPDGGDIITQESFPIPAGTPLAESINRAEKVAIKLLEKIFNEDLLSRPGTAQHPVPISRPIIGKTLMELDPLRLWHLLRGFPALLGTIDARLSDSNWTIQSYETIPSQNGREGSVSIAGNDARLHCRGGDIIVISVK